MNLDKSRFSKLAIVCLLVSSFTNAQTAPEPAESELKEIIPPSPSVANLMKFEEVPVNYYTGIPDISIPIYGTNAIGGYPINISLSYHPSGVAVDNIASWVGNGWSLNAGGSISRTMHGKPDDAQYGMLNNGFFNSGFSMGSSQNLHILYDVNVNNRYDTESDIFQFNFMGMSGRFYLKNVNNQVQIVMVSTNKQFKIEPIYSGTFNTIIKFKITDDNGFIYYFDDTETTTKKPYTSSSFLDGTTDTPLLPNISFISAWQLSKIETPNGIEICKFNYVLVKEEYENAATHVKNEVNSTDLANASSIFENNPKSILLPLYTLSKGTNTILTKKLSNIQIANRGTIVFTKIDERLDLLYNSSTNKYTGARLSKIKIKNLLNQTISSFDLMHSFEGIENRLVLNEIRQNDNQNNQYLPYQFTYNNIDLLPSRNSFNKDFWGYYNGSLNQTPFPAFPDKGIFYGANRNTNSLACTTGVLTEIKYPTNGTKKFYFESNTYSYIGDELKSDLDIPENRVPLTFSPNTFTALNDYDVVYISKNQVVSSTISAVNYSNINDIKGYQIKLIPKVLNQAGQNAQSSGPPYPIPTLNHFDPDSNREELSVVVDDCLNPANPLNSLSVTNSLILKEGWYVVQLKSTNCIPFFNVSFDFSFNYYKLNNSIKFNKGGGLRIQKIEFLDGNDVLVNKNYNYRMFNNPELSSGSLIDFPIHSYDIKRSAFYNTIGTSGSIMDFRYKVTSDYGNAKVQKSQGDIGYKNVEVTETNNGKQQFVYTSPIDYPESPDMLNYPFMESLNHDYKRGLLKETIVRSETGEILTKEYRNYELDEVTLTTGFNVFNPQFKSCGYTKIHSTYSSFINGTGGNCTPIEAYNGGWLDYLPTQTISGWAKLSETISETHFNNSTNIVSTTSKNFYENINHKQITKVEITENDGRIITKNIRYPQDILNPSAGIQKLITQHQIAKPVEFGTKLSVEEIINNLPVPVEKFISKQSTVFGDFGNNLVLPQKIQLAKEDDMVEDRLAYQEYDVFGNILQVSQNDGTPISYIWGYNNAYPIAKLNGVYHASISNLLGYTIDTGSAGLTAQNIIDLKSAFPNAQIATYEYKPGVGITSATDSRGYKTTFVYDEFNRLKSIKDNSNNLLSNYEYVYDINNFVRTTEYQVPTTNGNVTDDQKIESITYIDAIGRPIQSITKQAGGNKQDIIVPMVYDNLGRQPLEYLPYANASQTPGTGNLNYRDQTALLSDLETYYVSKYPEDQISTSTINAYSEKHFEASPLNRVLEQGAPGADWLVNKFSDTDHTIKFENLTNAEEEVKLFRVIFPTLNNEEPRPYYQGFYAENELYKTVTRDENWQPGQAFPKSHTTEEFKDKQGRVVLKRTYDATQSNIVQHDTYYVYDDFGNLTYVLSPKGSDLVLVENKYESFTDVFGCGQFIPLDKKGDPITTGEGSTTLTVDDEKKELTIDFDLNFDSNINLKTGPIGILSNTIPDMVVGTISILGAHYLVSIQDGYLYITGSGIINYGIHHSFTVNLPDAYIQASVIDDLCYQYHYDYRNRLIEKKIPQKGWEYIIYNKLDQPIMTQDAILGAQNRWLFTKYDAFGRVAYTGLATKSGTRASVQTNANAMSIKHVTKNSSPTTIAGTQVYYGNVAYPTANIVELHTINYYDDYVFDKVNGSSETAFGKTPTTNVQGLATGSKVRVLGTGDWITSVSYYDEKARPIYTYTHNPYLQTTDKVKSELDFVGKVLATESSHTKGTNSAIIVNDTFSYDHMGRLLTQEQQIGTGGAQELIVKNTYDELGQLATKGVGGIEASPLQDVDYTYNIRGWLKGINDTQTMGNDLFAFDINYNTVQLNQNNGPLYNGNIAETIWKTANDVASNTTRGYAYAYDALNRLNRADMAVKTTGSFSQATGYHVNNINYDKNGNIMSLQRVGAVDVFDNLAYVYSGNQLIRVTDAVTNQQSEGFIDGNTTGNDYTYDSNGNMKTDKNKHITEILYNHLNLPTKISIKESNDPFALVNYIHYIYDAMGVKQSKRVEIQGVSDDAITQYAGSYIYEGSYANGYFLKFFSHPEGYVEPDGSGGFDYVYQYKDHLGNIRLSYKDVSTTGTPDLEILEENNYYPFGLKHKGYNNVVNGPHHPYGYNGKEENDELGLEWLDFGARNYDASLGRWFSIDALAEFYALVSPYNYAINNPIKFTDPDGMAPQDVIIEGSAENKKAFLEKINKNSETQFGIKEDTGELYVTNPKECEGIFAGHLVDAINSENVQTLKLVDASESVMIDAFKSGEVDMGDMLSGDSDTFKDNVLHFVMERNDIEGGYDKNKDTASGKDFGDAHKAGINAEIDFIKETFGEDLNIEFKGEGYDNSSLSVGKDGTGSINYTFDFGDIKLNFNLKVITDENGKISVTNEVLKNEFVRSK